MIRPLSTWTLLALATLLAGCPPHTATTGPASVATRAPNTRIIADLADDFAPARNVGDAARGSWKYFMADSTEPASWTLASLKWGQTWRMNDPGENFGYVADHLMHLGAVTGPNPAVKAETAPTKGFCAMHPGTRGRPVLAEWTCPVEAPVATVSGAVGMPQFGGESGVQFWVWKKSAGGALTNLVPVLTIRDNDGHTYSADTSLAPGDKLYFVLGPNGSFWSDHTHVAATVSVPR